MGKKYFKPKIKIKKIKLNLFFRSYRRQMSGFDGVLLAGCTCNGIHNGTCGGIPGGCDS